MDIILKYFPNLNIEQQNQFKQLPELYAYWNDKINVVSRKDIENISINHILHSCTIAKYYSFKENSTIADVGTGGGFPGIPLSILFPECTFYLVDSIAKKLKVVNEVAKSIGLKNVQTLHSRIEKTKPRYNVIVSRAVTQFPKFVALVKHKLEKKADPTDGIIYLKGGDFAEEVELYKNKIEIMNLQNDFAETFFETKKIIFLPTQKLFKN
jgi:16S rRNA (guanine527-N7)-methyltransferase